MEAELDAPAQGPKIVDPNNVPIQFVDLLLNWGIAHGVINLTFGTVDHSRKNPEEHFAHAVIASRLRLSVPFAEFLHSELGKMLEKSKVEPEGPGDFTGGLMN